MSLEIAVAAGSFQERGALSARGGVALRPQDLRAWCDDRAQGKIPRRQGSVATALRRGATPVQIDALCDRPIVQAAETAEALRAQVERGSMLAERARQQRFRSAIIRTDLPPRPIGEATMSLQMKAAKAGIPTAGAVEAGIFGTIGNILKGGVRAIPGPIGEIGRQLFPNGQRPVPGAPPGVPTVPRPPVVRPGGGRQLQAAGDCPPGRVRFGTQCVDPFSILPGGQPFSVPVGGAPAPQGMQIACPPGFRPNKTSYFLRDGTFVAEGTKCVKIRRRNPLNPKALDRAISRISQAKRASKKLSRVTVRKKKC